MLKKLSLKRKMIGVFALSSLSLFLVGMTGFYTLQKVSAKYDYVARVSLNKIIILSQIRSNALEIRVVLNRLGVAGLSEKMIQESIAFINKKMTDYEEGEKAYLEIPFIEGEEKLYDMQNESWKKVNDIGKQLLTFLKKPEAHEKYVSLLTTDFRKNANQHSEELTTLIDSQAKEAKKWVADSESTARSGNILSGIMIVVGCFFALLLGQIFSDALSKTLNQIAQTLSHGANEVALASRKVSDAGAELSSGATEQAAALQETVASVDEISAMVSKNAENAQTSREVSTRGHESAQKGKLAVEGVIQAIEEINRSNTEIMAQIENSNREISNIAQVIGEIGNKTKVIDDIVFQTKLLSFNASVEAARAGEHGKGFAVVAEEVGNLAQMSGNAAKEISQMLQESIQKVEGIVTETRSKMNQLVAAGKEKVEAGTVVAKHCGELLNEIVTDNSEVSRMVSEIAVASSEQSQGVQEVSKAMSQLDQVTQQNATASQDSASAAVQLSKQAEALRGAVSLLNQAIKGTESEQAFAESPSVSKKALNLKAKVLPFPAKKAAKAQGNWTQSTPHKSVHQGSPPPPSSALAMGMSGVPSASDSRFEDV